MSLIYEVLIETTQSLDSVSSRVASALGVSILDEQTRVNRVSIDSDSPIVVGTAGYADEGTALPLSRYSHKVVTWSENDADHVFDVLESTTDWPIALFNEELYQITRRRDTLVISA